MLIKCEAQARIRRRKDSITQPEAGMTNETHSKAGEKTEISCALNPFSRSFEFTKIVRFEDQEAKKIQRHERVERTRNSRPR